MEQSQKDKYKELEEWYKHELQKRDKEIEDLKKSNQALLKTALKQANLNLKADDIKEAKDG